MRAFDKDKDGLVTIEEFVAVLVDFNRGTESTLSDKFIDSSMFDKRWQSIRIDRSVLVCCCVYFRS